MVEKFIQEALEYIVSIQDPKIKRKALEVIERIPNPKNIVEVLGEVARMSAPKNTREVLEEIEKIPDLDKQIEEYIMTHERFGAYTIKCIKEGKIGYYHTYEYVKQKILKENYGIEWFSPAEENPNALYD